MPSPPDSAVISDSAEPADTAATHDADAGADAGASADAGADAGAGAGAGDGQPPTRDGSLLPSVPDLLAVAVAALGGQPRPGQQQMADEVCRAVGERSALLVQAGTGTGKSLGYLVPAVHHAVTHDARVIVSTATLALQAQIVTRDLPRLADAVRASLGRDLTYGLVKGRSNYVCRHKLAGAIPDDADDSLFPAPLPGQVLTGSAASSLGKEVVRLREWAEETDTGDRDDLTPGVSDRAWRQVSVTALECLGGQRCPAASECFSEAVRARAREVDIVVTNHALLAIDTFEGRSILPEHDTLIVDEAHELADRVTGVVTDQLTGPAIEAAAAKARRNAGVDVADLLDAADSLGAVLETLPGGRFTPRLPEALLVALTGVRDATRRALSDLKDAGSARSATSSEASGAISVARAALMEIFEVCERLIEESSDDVAWLTVSDFRGSVRRTVSVAPLQVAGRLRERLYEDRSVILTSATLTIGGGFEAVARSVGLGATGSPGHRAVDVGSPFDYPRQAILYVARSLPPPGRDGTSTKALAELAALMEAAGGRTLGLFSSRAAAATAADTLRERVDFPILCQGEDSMSALVRAFAADQPTCLFGTLSLWQGVDVPGRSCQLVVIDRIPFPRPDDPLLSARAEAVARHGGNGFMSVSAHHAALRLAQGAGRLIRSMDDRGVVAVLDSRLVTARYGAFLTASLPPMWRTVDPAVARSALRRLGEG